MSVKGPLTSVLLSLLFTTAGLGSQDQAGAEWKASPVVTAASSAGNVRFSSPLGICQIRVRIESAEGLPLFDSAWKDGDVLDWPIDRPGQPVVSGSYRCVVMVRDLDGQVTQREATLTARDGQVTIDPYGGNNSISVVGGGEGGPRITVLAHDGINGAIASTGGDLTFRFGNFLAGKDSERMRLTSDGRLGVGTDKPAATLDVNGLIRTNQGILFPDGTILTSIGGQLTTQPGGTPADRPNTAAAVSRSVLVLRPALAPGSRVVRPLTAGTPRFITTDTGVGIWNAAPAFTLDVGGIVNTNTAYYLLSHPSLGGDFNNTLVGIDAGPASVAGVYSANVFVGPRAGGHTAFGAANTFVGFEAGGNNNGTGGGSIHAGGDNTFIGSSAGRNATIEQDNTLLGSVTDILTGVTNSTAIGKYAYAAQSNTVILGSVAGVNYATTTASTGIATQYPNQYLGVGGGITVDANNTNNGTVLGNSVIAFGTAVSNGISGEAIASQRSSGGNQYGLDFYTLYGKRMSITNGGNVGIATATPSATFEVAAGRTTLADAWTIRSSARFKDNIQPIEGALEKTEQLRGVSFDYKEGGAHSLGFIAEEVAAVVPEAVQYDASGEVAGLDYSRITPLLVEALKAQEKIIARLQESNRLLEGRVEQLEAARREGNH